MSPIVHRGVLLCFGERGEDEGTQVKRLSDKAAQAETKPGRYGDGLGLYLEVRTTKAGTLSKSWTLRYQVNEKRRDMGLGPYPAVTLTEARKKANETRVLIARGSDPLATRAAARKFARQAQKPMPTFGEIAKLVIADAQAKSTNAKARYQWARHLGPDYVGALLDRAVNGITTIDVAAVLRPIWRSKPEVARKLHPA
jgi:Arm DNA-binding domain